MTALKGNTRESGTDLKLRIWACLAEMYRNAGVMVPSFAHEKSPVGFGPRGFSV